MAGPEVGRAGQMQRCKSLSCCCASPEMVKMESSLVILPGEGTDGSQTVQVPSWRGPSAVVS